MTMVAISTEGISKQYRLGVRRARYRTLSETISGYLRIRPQGELPVPAGGAEAETSIWALRDVSFDVPRGQVVGIVGRNGAGKSTLLKVLSRITEPTSGRARVWGRVGSLLEVATGFHPELTGRENIYLNGAILGMRRAEINRKFDEIVAFAEIERFLDTPVKFYSSGMYVRLAFAVAAHMEPEILLVDEVLAVGDLAFQKKCLGKMGNVAESGRTILFVSHNMGAVTRLCGRALWIDSGCIVADGGASQVVARYQAHYLTLNAQWSRPQPPNPEQPFAFLSVSLRGDDGRPVALFNADEPIEVEIRYAVLRTLSGCQVGTRLHNADGLPVFTTIDTDGTETASATVRDPGRYAARFAIPGHLLTPGTYSFLLSAHAINQRSYELIEQAVTFEVSGVQSLVSQDGRLGVVAPLLAWQTQRETAA
jgi:lipopolysaccharide transport system ATP-binding protein